MIRQLLPQRVRAGPGMGLRIGRGEASADYRHGTNELPVQVAIVDALRADGVFFDIGANVGFFSLLAARAVGSRGVVHAFEPVHANAARIGANARYNRLGNVVVHEVAVTDASGTVTLVLAAHPGGAAVASAGAPPDAVGSVEVPAVTVDELVLHGSVRAPSVVKIDVEGAEAAVLRGMAGTLEQYRPVVVCEVDAADADVLAAKRIAVSGLLVAAGYDVEDLEPSYAGGEWQVTHLLARPGE